MRASIVVPLVGLVWSLACNSDDDASQSSSGSTGTNQSTGAAAGGSTATDNGGDTGASETGSEDVQITGVAIDLATTEPIEGMQICWFEHPDHPCATTGADGTFVIGGLPIGEAIGLEYTHADYFPTLVYGVSSEPGEAMVRYFAIPNAFADAVAQAIGAPPDPSKGHITADAFDADNQGVADVTFTISPMSGLGPGYGTGALPDTSLQATTEVGNAVWINVDPGEVEITATHPSLTCTRHPAAIEGPAENVTIAPVVAGYITHLYHFYCT